MNEYDLSDAITELLQGHWTYMTHTKQQKFLQSSLGPWI